MRFTSIALPLFALIAVAVQSHASPAANSVASIQRRDVATADTYFLQGDEDSLGYNNIACSSGTGGACYENILVAIEKAIESYMSHFQDETTGSGPAYGFDDAWEVVATIYYSIPEFPSSSDDATLFVEDGILDTLAESIISSLSSLNVIKACTKFEVYGNAFPGSTVVVAMGWSDQAYWADPETFQNWVTECEDQ